VKPGLVAVAALAAAALMRPTVDPIPVPRGADRLAWLSAARPTAAATALWADTVLRFTQASSADDLGAERVLSQIGTLDPGWSIPWWYGALMCGHVEQRDARDRILVDASARFPSEDAFPAMLGMTRWMEDADAEAAARWLREAADRDDPQGIHAAAARRFSGQP